MPVALRAGGMTEDTLILQQKLSTRTGQRRFTSSKSDTAEKGQKRGEGPHGRVRVLSLEVTKKKANTSDCFLRRSVRAAGTLADRWGSVTPAQK